MLWVSHARELRRAELQGVPDWKSLAAPCATETCLWCQGGAAPHSEDNGVKGHSGSLQSQLQSEVQLVWASSSQLWCVFKDRDCSASLGHCPG